LIEYLRPDVIVKGGDWVEDKVVGRDSVRKWGGQVAIIPEIKGASTTNIVEKIKKVYRSRNLHFFFTNVFSLCMRGSPKNEKRREAS